MTRLRASLWVFAVYPWLMLTALYVLWGSAYLILGRQLTDADGQATMGRWVGFWEYITVLMVFGTPLIVFLGIILFCWDV